MSDRQLRRFPSRLPSRRGWALIDPGSGKLIAGVFATEAECRGALRRLGMGRVELVETYRG